jgi:signal transduction histidine kinase/ActR/RegA family two-component response regulator
MRWRQRSNVFEDRMASPAEHIGARASVESVITTAELSRRPARAPDFEAENKVLLRLANVMARDPRGVLQELVDSARQLCRAGSAGISLLDPEQGTHPTQFRWMATSGGYAPLAGNTLPRNFSPCGTVLDQNRLLLMTNMVEYFPYVATLSHPPCEVLLVPFYRDAEPIGTVWVAAHSKEQQFDLEDARLVTSLSQFAAAAVQVIQTAEANHQLQENARLAAERELQLLAAENKRIAAAAVEREQAEAVVRRELNDTRLLRDLAARSIVSGDAATLLEAILDAALVITEADAGTIQLLDRTSRSLSLLATRGFDSDMTSHFARVEASSGSPCGKALARSERTFVRFDDPEVADPDGALKLHLDTGLRCAQSTPLTSRSGVSLGMFSTHWRERRDLTEREMRFLDLLARQAADLIERSQAIEALRSSEAELRETDRQKDEFLAVLAHELRNPLVPIRNGIELLKRVHDHPLIEKVRPMMERQVGHAVHLIDDLLDVSRISSGKIVLQRELITVSDMVESAVEANRAAIAEAELELHVDLENPDRLLEVDTTRLPQVISNILHNATKFTPRRGKITLVTEWVTDRTGPMLVLRITDTGVGIPKESLTRVFGLFTQVHAESSVQQGGLGIGLALAQKLINLHGGSIEADSAGPGQGSVFTVRIPMPANYAEAAAAIAAASDDLNGLSVLVVDDNRDAADSIGLLISELGAKVRIAYTGMQALQILREFDPALVLLDIGMPDINGYQACEQIRRLKGAAVSIVAVTGWGQDADRKRTAAAGFDAHLTKPVNLEQLVALAQEARAR